MEWLLSAGKAFAAIAPVELPDKTFVATLVLATRYRPLAVWLGVASAFALHCAVAVAAGSVATLLPATPVRLAAAGLFALGAVVMLRGARGAGAEGGAGSEQQHEYEQKVAPRSAPAPPKRAPRLGLPRPALAAYGASFLLLFTAEWGDLSQLLTVGLVASGEPPAAVYLGAWSALAAVSGAAVLAGRWVLARIRLALVRYLAAGVCALLAVITTVTAFA